MWKFNIFLINRGAGLIEMQIDGKVNYSADWVVQAVATVTLRMSADGQTETRTATSAGAITLHHAIDGGLSSFSVSVNMGPFTLEVKRIERKTKCVTLLATFLLVSTYVSLGFAQPTQQVDWLKGCNDADTWTEYSPDSQGTYITAYTDQYGNITQPVPHAGVLTKTADYHDGGASMELWAENYPHHYPHGYTTVLRAIDPAGNWLTNVIAGFVL